MNAGNVPRLRLWFLLKRNCKKRGKRRVNRNSSPRERWMLSDIFPSNKFERMFSKTDLISLKALSANFSLSPERKKVHWSRKHWSWSDVSTVWTPADNYTKLFRFFFYLPRNKGKISFIYVPLIGEKWAF